LPSPLSLLSLGTPAPPASNLTLTSAMVSCSVSLYFI
jgi:hypothetical protein